MTTIERPRTSDSRVILNWLNDAIVHGVFPLSPAHHLAYEYMLDQNLSCRDCQADTLVRQETSRHFTSGFLRGLAEQLDPPLAVPPVMAAAWVIEARIAAAVAVIYGHGIANERIRAEVMASLLGDTAIPLLMRLLELDEPQPLDEMITRLSHDDIERVMDVVGARLLGSDEGRDGGHRLLDRILIANQGPDQIVDATSCYVTGRTAISMFRRACVDDPTAGNTARLTYWEPPS